MAEYNGHKNYNYWNVSLWINNDERLYNQARYCVESTKTKTEAAKMFIAAMHDAGTPKTKDGAKYTVSAVKCAMSGM